MAYMSPSRNTLSNKIEKSSVTNMLDLRRKLTMGANVLMSSDHINKKGLHHLVKGISMWNTKDNRVKRITLDTDALGGTIDDTAYGINVSLLKLDTEKSYLMGSMAMQVEEEQKIC